MRKKVIIIAGIVVLVLAALVVIPKIGAETRQKAYEVWKEGSNWITKQRLYAFDNGEFGNFSQIGYTAPTGGSFTYSEEIKNGVAYWIAKNKEDLGKCPAGSQWILLIKNAKKNANSTEAEARLPENESCQKLTPDFSKLSK